MTKKKMCYIMYVTKKIFTIIELIIVLAIIGTLTALPVTYYLDSQQLSKMRTFEANINEIVETLNTYKGNKVLLGIQPATYPQTLNDSDFKALFAQEPINPYTGKSMLSSTPADSGIQYQSDGSSYSLCVTQRDIEDVNKNNNYDEPLPVSVAQICGPLVITITEENGVITITEDTQTDFLNGELNSVTATDGSLVLNQRAMLKFDGIDDHVHIPRIKNVKYRSHFTIEMLIRIDSITTTQTLFTISRTQAEQRNQAVFSLVPSDGGVKLNFWDYSKPGKGKGKTYGFPQDFVSDTVLSPGQIYHVAFVKNVGRGCAPVCGTFYVNGEPAGSMKGAKNIHYDSNDVYLGYDNAKNNYYYKGYIDEVRIWNKARTQDELRKNINNELKGNESGLTAYWKLDENSGTTIYDSTPNHSNGTIYGAQWVSNGYQLFGTRTSPIYNIASIGAVASSTISWTAVTPIDTSVTVETRISLDGGNTWSEWQQCTNGGAVPGLPVGTDLSNARIQIQQTLSTSNADVTPQLDKVVIQITPSE